MLSLSLRDNVTRCKPAVVKVISTLGRDENGNTVASFGSGFIVNSAGYVVTNNHVIENRNANANFVQFSGRTIKRVVNIISTNVSHDYAILEIEPGEYPVLELGEFSD